MGIYMNTLKTTLSVAFIVIIIFISGMVAGIKANHITTMETMNHFKGIYMEGHQYFCTEEKPDNGK